MLLQAPEIEHVVVPVGGGGLISGVLLSRDGNGRSDVRVTGAQPMESSAMYHVLRGARMSEIVHRPTIADGLAGGGDEGAITNELIARNEVPLVLVEDCLLYTSGPDLGFLVFTCTSNEGRRLGAAPGCVTKHSR